MLLYVGRLPLSYFGYRELEIIFRKYGTITDSSMFSGDRYGTYSLRSLYYTSLYVHMTHYCNLQKVLDS